MLGWKVDAVTAAISAIAACWIAALVQTVVLQSRLNRIVPAGPRHMRVGPWVAAAVPVLLVQSFDMLLQNTDVLVIAHYRSPEDVGMYYAALMTIGLISFIHFAVAAASAYQFSAAHAARDDEALRRKVHDAVTWTFWPSLVLAAALLIMGKPLLAMFGSEFTQAYPAMFVLAVGLIVRASMGPAEYVLNMLGQQKACALALSVGAAMNLVLNLVLVPEYGLMGAAIGTAVAVASASLMMSYEGVEAPQPDIVHRRAAVAASASIAIAASREPASRTICSSFRGAKRGRSPSRRRRRAANSHCGNGSPSSLA